jgi:hypothetical protein
MEITDILAAGAAIASAVAAYIVFHFSNKANEINLKSTRLNSMTKIFEVLNDNAHRNARIRLYVAAKYLKTNKNKCRDLLRKLAANGDPDIIIPESENIVLADFDQIGSLLTKELIPERVFTSILEYNYIFL